MCYGSNGSSVYINNIYKIYSKYYITDALYSVRWNKKKRGNSGIVGCNTSDENKNYHLD